MGPQYLWKDINHMKETNCVFKKRVLYLLCDKRLGCLSWMKTVHGLDKLMDLGMDIIFIIIIISSSIIDRLVDLGMDIIFIIISSSIKDKVVDLRIKMLSFRVVCSET